jgi:hypothetical protein
MSTISTGNAKSGDSSDVNGGNEAARAGTQSSAWSRVGKVGALGGLIGLTSIAAASYLSRDEDQGTVAASPAGTGIEAGHQPRTFLSGMGKVLTTGISSLATFVVPQAEPLDYSGPEKPPGEVDLGMNESAPISSRNDLMFAVADPAVVIRLNLGPWNLATDTDLSPLISYHKLKHLSVSGGDNLSGAFLDHLRGIPLIFLSLEGLTNFNGENLKHLRYSGTLNQLVIAGCPIKSEHLKDFDVDELPALRSLAFENTGLTVKEIGDMVSSFFDKGAIPSLKDVVVRGVGGVTPDDITSARSWLDKMGSGASFTIQFRDGRFQELLPGGLTRE